jgi:sugar lactone lactonase YvrE
MRYKLHSYVCIGYNGAGSGLNQLNSPNSVYFDYLSTNSLYVADSGNNRIMKFPSGSTSATSGTMVAGNGIAGSAANQLNNPRSVVVDCAGILYITDAGNRKVKK